MRTSDGTCTLYMVRHGETEWNRNGRAQGQTDVPLSAVGRAQADGLARRLRAERIGFDALYSSDLRRASETAEAVGRALGLAAVTSPSLREIDLGRWSGRTDAEIARDFPDEWSRLGAGEDVPRGGGETFAAMVARVMRWMNETADRHAGGRVCVVTHGGCVRAALLGARGLSWTERAKIPPLANVSVSVVRGARGRWEVVAVNQLAAESEGAPPAIADEGTIV